MSAPVPRILGVGAHPDDAEFHVGGLISLYRELDFAVKIISVTNGAASHYNIEGDVLARRRLATAQAASAPIGSVFEAWDCSDGQLEPTLDLWTPVIHESRKFKPDLVLTHRFYDYHPNHRAVAQLVQDASYMITVPPIFPDTPILPRDPVVAYMPALFTRPNPLRADVIIDVTVKMEPIVQLLACHMSQVFEWVPFNQGILDQIPGDDAARLSWLRNRIEALKRPYTDRDQAPILDVYGRERGRPLRLSKCWKSVSTPRLSTRVANNAYSHLSCHDAYPTEYRQRTPIHRYNPFCKDETHAHWYDVPCQLRR